MTVRRKRTLGLGASRMLGAEGVRHVITQESSVWGSSTTTPSLTGLATGDLVLIVASMTGVEQAYTSFTSTGMTFTRLVLSGSNAVQPTVYYGFTPDATSRTVTTNTAGTTAVSQIVSVWRGVDQANPFDLAGVEPAVQLASSSTPTVPGRTTTYPGAMMFTAMATDPSATLAVTQSGWSDVYQRNNLNGQMSFGLANKVYAAAGASGDIAWSRSSAGVCRYTSFALKPLL